jgi:hypothetical protein
MANAGKGLGFSNGALDTPSMAALKASGIPTLPTSATFSSLISAYPPASWGGYVGQVGSGSRLLRYKDDGVNWAPDACISVPSGKGDVEIMEAHDWILARFPYGTIKFDPFGSYTIGSAMTLESGVAALEGNRCTWNVSGLSAGQFACTFNNTQNGDGPATTYPMVSEISNIRVNGGAGRDNPFHGFRFNGTINSSLRTVARGVHIENFGTGLSIGSRGYLIGFEGLEVHTCGVGLLQESGVTDFAENIVFVRGAIFNCDTLVKDLAGSRKRFYGVSFDHFGDDTGNRITGTENAFDLRAGSQVELFGCHVEWVYGKYAAQTRSPISLTGALTRFIMHGGFLYYTEATRQPYYRAPIMSDNASQTVALRDVSIANLARTGQPTVDNELVCGSLANNTGSVGYVSAQNLITGSVNDMPAAISMTPGPSFLRSGIDNPYVELDFRAAKTGTLATSNVGTTDGAVTARNATGNMLKITGAGKYLISLNNFGNDCRHMYAFFLNCSQAVGTVTVKQRDCSVIQKWDGATGITVAADTRNSYASGTKTIACGGTNQFEIVTWKDTLNGTGGSPRMSGGEKVVIEIDTSAMTSGAIYLDDFANGVSR